MPLFSFPTACPMSSRSATASRSLRRGSKVADKNIKQTSPEEVTGLIIGAIEAA